MQVAPQPAFYFLSATLSLPLKIRDWQEREIAEVIGTFEKFFHLFVQYFFSNIIYGDKKN